MEWYPSGISDLIWLSNILKHVFPTKFDIYVLIIYLLCVLTPDGIQMYKNAENIISMLLSKQ